jgi:methylglutaconyl-CoA hydratase
MTESTAPKVLLTYEEVDTIPGGLIAYLTLNNPERQNALSAAVVADLTRAAQELAVHPRVRAVILHGGEAKAFCSGADLKERIGLTEPEVMAAVHRLREAVNTIAGLPMPVIAAVHGIAFGGGCELALAADLRIMASDATIGLTEVGWGIIPGAGGCARLPGLVGAALAKELIFTARKLTAAEALQIGLVNRVVEREQLLEQARAFARAIAQQGPLAVRAAKRAINGSLNLGGALAVEWEAYQSIIPTKDREEGLRAFQEKRQPVYHGE